MDKILEIFKELIVKLPIWIEQAEQIYTGVKQGKYKKEYVLQLLDAFLNEFGVVEYRNIIVEFADTIIDTLVKGYNLTGFFGKKVKIDIKEGETL